MNKKIEVIATRDYDGILCVWHSSVKPYRLGGCWGAALHQCVAGGRPLIINMLNPPTSQSDAKDMIGGTFCGIRKGGIKRLGITKTIKVEEL